MAHQFAVGQVVVFRPDAGAVINLAAMATIMMTTTTPATAMVTGMITLTPRRRSPVCTGMTTARRTALGGRAAKGD